MDGCPLNDDLLDLADSSWSSKNCERLVGLCRRLRHDRNKYDNLNRNLLMKAFCRLLFYRKVDVAIQWKAIFNEDIQSQDLPNFVRENHKFDAFTRRAAEEILELNDIFLNMEQRAHKVGYESDLVEGCGTHLVRFAHLASYASHDVIRESAIDLFLKAILDTKFSFNADFALKLYIQVSGAVSLPNGLLQKLYKAFSGFIRLYRMNPNLVFTQLWKLPIYRKERYYLMHQLALSGIIEWERIFQDIPDLISQLFDLTCRSQLSQAIGRLLDVVFGRYRDMAQDTSLWFRDYCRFVHQKLSEDHNFTFSPYLFHSILQAYDPLNLIRYIKKLLTIFDEKMIAPLALLIRCTIEKTSFKQSFDFDERLFGQLCDLKQNRNLSLKVSGYIISFHEYQFSSEQDFDSLWQNFLTAALLTYRAAEPCDLVKPVLHYITKTFDNKSLEKLKTTTAKICHAAIYPGISFNRASSILQVIEMFLSKDIDFDRNVLARVYDVCGNSVFESLRQRTKKLFSVESLSHNSLSWKDVVDTNMENLVENWCIKNSLQSIDVELIRLLTNETCSKIQADTSLSMILKSPLLGCLTLLNASPILIVDVNLYHCLFKLSGTLQCVIQRRLALPDDLIVEVKDTCIDSDGFAQCCSNKNQTKLEVDRYLWRSFVLNLSVCVKFISSYSNGNDGLLAQLGFCIIEYLRCNRHWGVVSSLNSQFNTLCEAAATRTDGVYILSNWFQKALDILIHAEDENNMNRIDGKHMGLLNIFLSIFKQNVCQIYLWFQTFMDILKNGIVGHEQPLFRSLCLAMVKGLLSDKAMTPMIQIYLEDVAVCVFRGLDSRSATCQVLASLFQHVSCCSDPSATSIFLSELWDQFPALAVLIKETFERPPSKSSHIMPFLVFLSYFVSSPTFGDCSLRIGVERLFGHPSLLVRKQAAKVYSRIFSNNGTHFIEQRIRDPSLDLNNLHGFSMALLNMTETLDTDLMWFIFYRFEKNSWLQRWWIECSRPKMQKDFVLPQKTIRSYLYYSDSQSPLNKLNDILDDLQEASEVSLSARNPAELDKLLLKLSPSEDEVLTCIEFLSREDNIKLLLHDVDLLECIVLLSVQSKGLRQLCVGYLLSYAESTGLPLGVRTIFLHYASLCDGLFDIHRFNKCVSILKKAPFAFEYMDRITESICRVCSVNSKNTEAFGLWPILLQILFEDEDGQPTECIRRFCVKILVIPNLNVDNHVLVSSLLEHYHCIAVSDGSQRIFRDWCLDLERYGLEFYRTGQPSAYREPYIEMLAYILPVASEMSPTEIPSSCTRWKSLHARTATIDLCVKVLEFMEANSTLLK